jgi:hypothetical protein
MSKRNTKSRGRARARRAPAPQVLDRHDEAGIAQFFSAYGMALMLIWLRFFWTRIWGKTVSRERSLKC